MEGTSSSTITADPSAIVVNTSAVGIDQFSVNDVRTAKYVISVSRGSQYQATEAMLVHNGTQTQLVTYADLYTGNALMTFSANINSSTVTLYGTGSGSGNAVKLQKIYVKV
jgi:hypothetical protein